MSSVMLWFWLISLLVAMAVGHALLTNRPRRGENHRFLPLALLLCPVIIFWYPLVPWYGPDKTPQFWAGYDVILLYLLQFVATGVIVTKMEGRRWYALSIGALAAWLSLWSVFMSLMAATNDWL